MGLQALNTYIGLANKAATVQAGRQDSSGLGCPTRLQQLELADETAMVRAG